tara:strand:+ start:652 stop:909 length:258 start_codon:yes stop_codon:yes gene_type:complete
MTGTEVVAIISVSVGGLATILTTCFHSRCTSIDCLGIHCRRKLIDDDEKEESPLHTFEKEHNLKVNPEIKKILDTNIKNGTNLQK